MPAMTGGRRFGAFQHQTIERSAMHKDHFSGRAKPLIGPATTLNIVTPSDDADLPTGTTRAIHVGTAGTVAVVDMNGNVATLASLDAQYHPVRVRRILATGTTATGIVAMY
jgi:hypothetical protein